jgi:hypothetical protein
MQEHVMLGFRIFSALALVLACALLIVSGVRWRRADSETTQALRIASINEKLANAGGQSGSFTATSPLITQAEVFAAHLAGPANPQESSITASEPNDAPVPPAASPTGLKLHATSYYPDRPGKSMALISDISIPQEDPRWVKEDSRCGDYIIHEIRPSMIVYRQGDRWREATVERVVGLSSIVRDPRNGSHRAPVAAGALFAVPADPNSVGISSN